MAKELSFAKSPCTTPAPPITFTIGAFPTTCFRCCQHRHEANPSSPPTLLSYPASPLSLLLFPPTLITPLPRLPLQTHGTPLHHNGHDLEQGVRRRHGGQFGVGIVSRRHLHDIGRDEIQALEAADNGAEFARGPAARFGGAGGGGVCFWLPCC